VTSNVVVHCLGPTRIDHRDEMIDEQLGHDGLIGLGRSLGQGGVRGVQLSRPGVQAGPGGVQRRRGVRLPPRESQLKETEAWDGTIWIQTYLGW